jgi:phosphoribosylanthranilate isomerase
VTCVEDALAAIEADADALGFNGWPGSKRYVDFAVEGEWIGRLPSEVSRVAVLVNPTMDEALRVAALPFIDLVQLHGRESHEFCAALSRDGIAFIKAMSVGTAAAEGYLESFGTSDFLIDACVEGAYGGTGQLIDLPRAERFVATHDRLRVWLAGGLTPENVAGAVGQVCPYAVDVASGVEMSENPRRKDLRKIKEFIAAAKSVT